jgi:hypothetical protein
MTQLGEKEIFIQFRASIKLRDKLKTITRWSSAESSSERIRMAIEKEWLALPEDKR